MNALEQFALLDQVWDKLPVTSSHSYQCGPYILKLAFASERLANKITRAFEHLKTEGAPDLTICLWDTKENEILPPLDWGQILRNGYRGLLEPPISFHYFDTIDALSALNSKANRAYYIVQDTDKLPWWVSGSPCQVILHAWLSEKGMQLTHAAAIGNDKRAVLLSGKGGSGKSTTTLSCLNAGCNYLSEDYCILSECEVFSIYQSAKLTPETRKLFPRFEPFIYNHGKSATEKALLYYRDLFPKQMRPSLPLCAMISLQVGDCETPVLKECTKEDAIKSLMMSTLLQLPLYRMRTMALFKTLAATYPRYHLTLGRDLHANTRIIEEILRR